MRAPQSIHELVSRDALEPLSEEETHDFLGKRWSHRVKPHSDDFTDKEAVATIVRVTRGNLRLIDRLMLQVESMCCWRTNSRWSRKKWLRRLARI